MSVAAIMRVKDEADVIEQNVRHLLTQVDEVIVSDNASTDGTFDILWHLSMEFDNVSVEQDFDIAYYQSRHMSALAEQARDKGHEWVIPVDADELWFSTYASANIVQTLRSVPKDRLIVEARLLDHVASAEDPAGDDPFVTIGWRREQPVVLAKVACRLLPGLEIEQGNHNARYPGEHVKRTGVMLEVRHFPYRSVEQFVRKVRNGAKAYAATNLPQSVGAHWRQYGDILSNRGEDGIREIFETWFYEADPSSNENVIFDPAPIGVPA